MSLMMPDGKSWTRPLQPDFKTYNGPMIPVAGKGGAPSYGQQSYGASGWGGQQSYGASGWSPYVNGAGEKFHGSMSFAPGTSPSAQNSAYQRWANQNGYYRPGQAQPIQQSTGSSYGTRVRRTPGYASSPGRADEQRARAVDGYNKAMSAKIAAQQAWGQRQGAAGGGWQDDWSAQYQRQGAAGGGWQDDWSPQAQYQALNTPSNQAFTQGWNDSMAQYANTPGMQFTPAQSFGGGGEGNLAYAQDRPQPFQTATTGFGAQMDPQGYTAQRDAFIQRLNDERGKLAAQSGVYYPNEIPKFYQPSRDFGSLWQQAGDMVSNGWTNPLASLFG